jgi:hypothetical protein
MNTRSATLLMPALCASDNVRHWPVALLFAQRFGGVVQSRVDTRLARARRTAKRLEAVTTEQFIPVHD